MRARAFNAAVRPSGSARRPLELTEWEAILSPGDCPVNDEPTGRTDRRIVTVAKSKGRGVLLGLTGGFVATLSMSAFREPTARAYPPTAEFWAKYVSGDDPADHLLPAVVLHLLYGTLAGGLFGALVGTSEDAAEAAARGRVGPDDPAGDDAASRVRRWTVLGGVYGLLLSEFGQHVLLERVNDESLTPDQRFLFHLGHLVYGLTLGAWCGYRD